MHLQSLDVESGLARLIEDGLVESGKGEWWHGNLALTCVGEEQVPSGRVVAREVRGMGERGLMLFLLGRVGSRVGFGIGLIGVDVFEV